MKSYLKLGKLGEGGQGVVSKAQHLQTGRMVAIKRMFMSEQRDGVSFSAIREIKALQGLKHPNIVELIEVFRHNDSVYVVFEFLAFDLEDVINDRSLVLMPAHIKSYMTMILSAVAECHRVWIMHRDLKPSNLLLATDGTLKLADFGLARTFGSPKPSYSPQAVTRWYRPPELLFGARQYGPSADMWSVGCIFAELIMRAPLFPADSELAQMHKIMTVMGTPTEAMWPGHTGLPDYVEYEEMPAVPLKRLFHAAEPSAVDLMQNLLVWDPAKRLSAVAAEKHVYFSSEPPACSPSELPKPNKHEGKDVEDDMMLDDLGIGLGGGGGGERKRRAEGDLEQEQ